jgi:hypothetical protein
VNPIVANIRADLNTGSADAYSGVPRQSRARSNQSPRLPSDYGSITEKKVTRIA